MARRKHNKKVKIIIGFIVVAAAIGVLFSLGVLNQILSEPRAYYAINGVQQPIQVAAEDFAGHTMDLSSVYFGRVASGGGVTLGGKSDGSSYYDNQYSISGNTMTISSEFFTRKTADSRYNFITGEVKLSPGKITWKCSVPHPRAKSTDPLDEKCDVKVDGKFYSYEGCLTHTQGDRGICTAFGDEGGSFESDKPFLFEFGTYATGYQSAGQYSTKATLTFTYEKNNTIVEEPEEEEEIIIEDPKDNGNQDPQNNGNESSTGNNGDDDGIDYTPYTVGTLILLVVIFLYFFFFRKKK